MSRFGSNGTGRSAVALVALIGLAALVGCGSQEGESMSEDHAAPTTGGPCAWTAEGDLPVVADLDVRLEGYVPTILSPDLGQLDATQKAVPLRMESKSSL